MRAQAPAANRLTPNLESNIERPLRYRPDNGDFVIENGGEFFNRPLYGGNTAFRVDAGDMPEFSLYLPGRGGNLRFGLKTATDSKWLHETKTIIARYRPGEMLYEIRDPLLGPEGLLRLSAVALPQTEGLVIQLTAENIPSGIELVFAFGGVNGKRGKRDGDIGTEAVPIGEYFQLKPEFCRDNRFTLTGASFTLQAQPARLLGLAPPETQLAVADADQWNSCAGLLASTGQGKASRLDGKIVGRGRRTPPSLEKPAGYGDPALQPNRDNASEQKNGPIESLRIGSDAPVVLGHFPLVAAQSYYFALQRLDAAAAGDLDTYREVTAPGAVKKSPIPASKLLPAFSVTDLPRVFAEAEAHFTALRGQIKVETPDPFLNAAVGALNVAADAVWDEPQQAIMHGAIAWRTKLLGWRGPYALDALGWHDRARANLTYWAGRQNTDPIPGQLPPADETANLARNEAGLHSNGDLSNSHYDMNTVFIDGLFRHLLWTGDVVFAKAMWPMIERHLAWERRLFRREFTAANGDKLPLYEAYAVIWASDDLQYSGGGAAHSSAYNYWHNTMAARLARLLGHDPSPYEREAGLIARGMRELLWQPEQGSFAEFKDLLGRQLVHPSAALWTFYHTVDSEVPSPTDAFLMSRDIESRLPRLPIRGPGVPTDRDYAIFASSDWLPYSWSINNVVMGENVHTALGFWQADRPEQAFTLLKSGLLASMFMGICPGNVGSMNYLDVYRRESQRDFADGSGVTSRAIVEGLFGVRPDALAGELAIAPGWPADWNFASLRHPKLELEFARMGGRDIYVILSKFDRPMTLRFRLPVSSSDVSAKVNGVPVSFDGALQVKLADQVTLEFDADKARPPDGLPESEPKESPPGSSAVAVAKSEGRVPSNAVSSSLELLNLSTRFNDRVTEIFQLGKYRSPRSPYVSLALPAQGIGAWAGHVNATAEIDDSGLRHVAAENGGRLMLPNGISFATPGPGESPNILFVSQWDNYPREATVQLSGKANRVHLLMAGSTNHMQSRLDNGEVVVTYTDGSSERLALRNPETWWPIEQDYFVDDFQFRLEGPLPTRVDLKTGAVRVLDAATFKGQGRVVPGGAATVLSLPLDPAKELKSLAVRALANEVVIGLMAVTLERPSTLP